MTPAEVAALVNSQLKLWGPRDIDELREYLIAPELTECLDPVRKGCAKLWLVWAEIPDRRGGYGIAYDEQSKEFGLVEFRKDTPPVLLNLHGSFEDAIETM